MGAGQSSQNDAGAAAPTDVKTSYYELLGIDRQATEDEIKKAYRKKALVLHPDRNYGNVEAATKLFAEVQSAYEVLSDPQERAWYDSHETAILRGDDPTNEDAHYEANVKLTSADDIARMIRKFNSNVSFTDAPSGFFGYLREIFEQLAKEEQAAAYIQDTDMLDYPSFGHKDDDYDDVVKPFYGVWQGFATKKSFSWKDQYRLSEAPDRRYRRAMEKENQRLRDEGIREFNDAVRSLVQFVRKRDPRYIPSQQSEAERQKILRDATTAQAARARAANAANLSQEIPEWARVAEKDEFEGDMEESESEEEVFECVACHKMFKSEKQYDAHEKSNKHKKAVQALRKRMEKENKHLVLEEDDGEEDEEEDEGPVDPTADAGTHHDIIDEDLGEQQLDHLSLEDKAPETKDRPMDGEDGNSEAQAGSEEEEEEEDQQSIPTSNPAESDEGGNSEDSDQDSDYAPASAIKDRLASSTESASGTPDNDKDTDPSFAPAESTIVESAPTDSTPKLGKAAQKRLKKAAAAASTSSDQDNAFSCATCKATFPSKTRMHQHIKDFGHAALKPVSGGGGGGGGGGKKKGKR